MRQLGAAAALIVTFALTPAHAKPSVWARAQSPTLAREADAIEAADRAVSRDLSLSFMPTSFRRTMLLKRTLERMRASQAATSTNASLRYRLGQVYYRLFEVEADVAHIEAATQHFEFVVSSPSLPTSERARALMSLAICYARLGRHEDEIVAYAAAIALQPDPISHAVLLANQAEAFMARGRIIAAVRGYQASLRATPSAFMIDSGVTTMWGLAVALDRSGDLDGALENVRRARSYDPDDSRLKGDHWFYVPAYDQHWYEALGFWQIARDVKNPEVKRQAYDAAIRSWRAFTDKARLDDPWVAIADFRTGQCEKERLEAMARAARKRGEQRDGPPIPKDPTLWPTP